MSDNKSFCDSSERNEEFRKVEDSRTLDIAPVLELETQLVGAGLPPSPLRRGEGQLPLPLLPQVCESMQRRMRSGVHEYVPQPSHPFQSLVAQLARQNRLAAACTSHVMRIDLSTHVGPSSEAILQEQVTGDSSSPGHSQSDGGEECRSASRHSLGEGCDETRSVSSKDREDRQRELNPFHSEQRRKQKEEKELKLLNDVTHLQIYHDLVENASDLLSLHTLDAGATFEFANITWSRVFGVQTESFLNTSLVEIAHPNDRSFVRRQLQGGSVNTFQFVVVIRLHVAVVECSIRAGSDHLVAVSRIRMVAPLGDGQASSGPMVLANPRAGVSPEVSSRAGSVMPAGVQRDREQVEPGETDIG